MSAGANIEISHAFVLTAVDAEKIWSMLAQSFDSVQASALCSDSIRREFTSADALIQYENPRSRAIRSLTYEARSDKPYARASIQFGGRYSSSVEMSISGPESSVLAIRDRLGEVLDGMRPWYSPISRVDFFYIVTGALFFAWLVFQGMSTGSASGKAMTFGQASTAAAVLIAFLFGVGMFIWALNRLRSRFFPVAAFAIGQGQGRFNFDEKLRWVVIVGFGVSVFASLVATFLLPAT